MEKHELTKVEALRLITPVVDGEATDEEQEAFMNFIAHNQEVRNRYRSIKNLKSVIASRCPAAKAPSSLYTFVEEISQKSLSAENNDPPIYDLPTSRSVSQRNNSFTSPANSASSKIRRVIVAVAAGLFIVAGGWTYFNYSETTTSNTSTYNIEQFAYEHFIKHEGKFVEPTISTASLGTAEIRLAADYDMPMIIPALKSAEFKGIVYGDFVPDFKAPMLEYHLPDDDQYIYIFAFKLDKLKQFGQLIRHQEAVKQCNQPKDFHIRNINGKHVVSWKWDDVWYAAISNHDGDTLASLVEPLQYNPEED